jgi:hypothetical protein
MGNIKLKGKRRILLECEGEDARMLVELKIKLLREGRTIKGWVMGAIKDKLAMEQEDKGERQEELR